MKSAPILIIDKAGLIGEPLFFKLSQEYTVVYVGNSPSANVPFSGKFPVIPDNKYSHIIFINEERRDLELLPKIVNKVKDVNADFIFTQGLSSTGEYAMNKVLRLCPSAKVVLLGDILEKNKFIYQAQRFGKIQIPGDGLREAYPVSLNDVVDKIIDLVFGVNDNHSLFYVFPKHPVTELSLAHMIQKASPEVKIDFIKQKSKVRNISYPTGGKYLLDDKYPIAEKIRNTDIKNNLPAGEKKKHGIKHFPIFIVWVLIFLILSPFVFTLIFSFLGFSALYFVQTQADKGSFPNIKTPLHLSNTFFYIGKKASDTLYFQGKIVGLENNLKRLLEDIDLGQRISEGLLQAFSSEVYFSKVLTGKGKNPTDDFAKGQGDLKSAIVILGKLRAEGKIPAPILQKIESVDSLIKLISNSLDVLPNIFGLEGEKTYLILFQDNMGLRPGGGLIGSYGILKLNMGKITHFSIHDIEDADKQLRGHVEPPFALRRYLPTNHWYMKDSNFDVDFVKSASASSNFLFAETGQKADGVIGVDNSLVTKIKEGKQSYLLIARSISDALTQKHLLFAFNNDFQNIFTANGWSSSLWDKRENDEKSVNDFLGINEANLGVNKVNAFIKRQVSQKVMIDNSGNISEELTINYKNASAALTGGNYKNYLRIILPIGAEISEISIQDNLQNIADAVTDPLVYESRNFKAPAGLEVEKTQEENKIIYGFIINVPVGEIVKIKIKYELANNVSRLNTFSYNLKLFKQPGVDVLPYSFSLYYPNSFSITNTSEGISKGDGKASYSKKITKDGNLIVDFAKK